MKHEASPHVPSNTGTFFNKAELKAGVLNYIDTTPEKYFMRNTYVVSPSWPQRSAIAVGLLGKPRNLPGCALFHLAYGGRMKESYSDILNLADDRHAGGRLRAKLLLPVIVLRYGIAQQLGRTIENIYEYSPYPSKATFRRIIATIPVGLDEERQEAVANAVESVTRMNIDVSNLDVFTRLLGRCTPVRSLQQSALV